MVTKSGIYRDIRKDSIYLQFYFPRSESGIHTTVQWRWLELLEMKASWEKKISIA